MANYPFRCLIVAGVSSKKQLGPNKLSIPRQLADGRALIQDRGWTKAKEIVIPGKSRYLVFLEDLVARCPEFADIIRTVRSGEIDLVVVRMSDRLFRTMELQQQIMAICRQHRVQVYDINSPREPVPPDELKVRAIDKFIDSVQGYRAEDEIEKFRERVRGSMELRITDRRLGGNHHHPPYGYRWAGRQKPLHQQEVEVRWLLQIRDWRLERLGWQAIAKGLNDLGVTIHGRPWHRMAVRRVLHNRFYWGDVRWGPARARGKHKPVFAEEDWLRLRQVDDEMRGLHPQSDTQYELSGLCRCAICGGPMAVHISTRRKPHHNQRLTLLCSRSGHRYDGRTPPEARHTNYHNEQAVVAYLVARVQAELSDPKAWAAARRQEIGEISTDVLDAIDRQLRERRVQLQRWDDAYEQGAISAQELKAHRQRLHAALESLQAERQRLEARQALARSVDAEAPAIAERVRKLPTLSPLERRELWLLLMRAVWLQAGHDPRPEWR